MTRTRKMFAAAAAGAVGLLIAGGAIVANAADLTSIGTSISQDADHEGGRGDHGGGMHEHTAVTGDELTKVSDAVTAANDGVTVTGVQKDPDGSYDVDATTADGTQVRYDVSADLATITERTGGPGGGKPGQTPGGTQAPGGTETPNGSQPTS